MSDLLPCQRDAYRRTLDTQVRSVERIDRDEAPFAVELAETILYPEGGGQPADHGLIETSAGRASVVDVQREGERVVHYTVDEPAVGDAVVRVDWARRYDHMQQHTAQHLLTAVCLRDHDLPTVSFHLGRDYSSIDLSLADNRADSLGRPVLERIETAANEAIRHALPVRWREIDAAGVDDQDVRARRLPDGRERLRVIEIEGLDRNACGGTHVSSTAELQLLVLLGAQSVTRGVRLLWLAGDRARARFHEMAHREARLQQRLSRPPDEFEAAVDGLIRDRSDAEKRFETSREELATLEGRALASAAGPVALFGRRDVEIGFLRAVAAAARERRPELLVIASSEHPDGTGRLVIAGAEEAVAQAAEIAADELGARGGGRPGSWQGRIERPGEVEHAFANLASTLR